MAGALVDILGTVRSRVPDRAADILLAVGAGIARAEVAGEAGAVVVAGRDEALGEGVVADTAVEARAARALVHVLLALLAGPSLDATADVRIDAVAAAERARLMAGAAAALVDIVTAEIAAESPRAVAQEVVV